MSIWNKRGKFPEDFTDTRGLFVYQFDDGVDVENYDEAFIYASNLIRWCRWNDLVYLEKENKQLQAEINRLREGLAQVINDAEWGDFIDLDGAKKILNRESEGGSDDLYSN